MLDHDQLDVSNVDKGVEEEEDDISGLDDGEKDGHSPKDNEDTSGDDGDKDDEGHVLGGDNVEADGAVEDWEIWFECNEVDDYRYRRPVDSDDSEAELDNR